MDFWESVKKDLEKGLKEGLDFLKEGAAIVKVKAEELTDEGKKRYKVYELKAKVQKEIEDLGGRVYDLSSKSKNPMQDKRVKAIMTRIKKFETRIAKLEGEEKRKPQKTAAKPKRKPTPKKK
jgi:peptidoglycan hydrolase CwlO-like protein